jgi:hypothetical protein
MDGGGPTAVVDGDGGMAAGVVVGVLGEWEMSVASRVLTLGEVEMDQMAAVKVKVVNTHKDAQGLHRRSGTYSRLRLLYKGGTRPRRACAELAVSELGEDSVPPRTNHILLETSGLQGYQSYLQRRSSPA